MDQGSEMHHILIVEDNPLLGLYLADLVQTGSDSDVEVVPSVADALVALFRGKDFAFLDINVLGGDTFDLARTLIQRHVPFAFVSARAIADVPDDLKTAPFISKPCSQAEVDEAMATLAH